MGNKLAYQHIAHFTCKGTTSLLSLVVFISTIMITIGCTTLEEENDMLARNNIQFDVQSFSNIKSFTRATLINDDNMASQTAVVSALLPNGTPYLDQKLISGTTKWQLDNIYLWPEEELDFYALMPNTFDGASEQTYTSFTYTTPVNSADQTDVMYACSLNQKEVRVLPLNFFHIFAGISFSAQINSTDIEASITNIKLHNIGTVATFSYSSATEGHANDYPSGTWTAPTVLKTLLPGIIPTTLSYTEKNVTDVGGELLVIPQTVTPWDLTSSISTITTGYLEITCHIKMKGYDKVGTTIEGIVTDGTIYVPFGDTWEQDHWYNYNIEFGVGYDENGDRPAINVNVTSTITNWVSGGTTIGHVII